jgi:hypothetical protein
MSERIDTKGKKLKPTIRHARKVIEVVSCGLTNGKGNPRPGEMCVEAAVCYAFGLPHGDDPPCVGQAVRAAKIQLNDSNWSSNDARAKGMIRVAVAQLGSNTIDQVKFATVLAELTIRRIVPGALRTAAKLHTVLEHQQKLNAAANRCEAEGSYDAASDAARYAASAADAAGDAARYAASAADAAGDAARYAADAASAADAAGDAAYAADAAGDAARYAASDAACDEILTLMAAIIEEALVLCKSPGCKWLFLLDTPVAN